RSVEGARNVTASRFEPRLVNKAQLRGTRAGCAPIPKRRRGGTGPQHSWPVVIADELALREQYLGADARHAHAEWQSFLLFFVGRWRGDAHMGPGDECGQPGGVARV